MNYRLRRLLDIQNHWFYLYYGVRNLVSWFSIIWKDRDWDHNFLLRIMEKKLSSMAYLHENHGHLLNNGRYARQLRIAAHLCKRLHEEPYYETASLRFDRRTANFVGAELQKQDKEMLGRLIGKYIDHWWD